jgi:phosphohistidine phosphatase
MMLMRLYLIRHADAVPLGDGGVDRDADRPLSEVGKQQCQALAGALQRVGVQFDAVLTSPLLRARQTADEIARHWKGPLPERELCAALALGEKLKRLARAVGELKQESVALVGHQPELAALAGWLIGSRKAKLDLEKAGVAALECEAEAGKGGGILVWLVTPKWYSAAGNE